MNQDKGKYDKQLKRQKNSSIAEPSVQDLDPQIAFLYQPRTITALLIGASLLVYFSGALSPAQQPTDSIASEISIQNTKRGILAAILTYIVYSILQGPKSPFIRPHPACWRAVYGIAMAYFMFTVWLLFQEVEDARLILKYLDPSLGVKLPERSYGNDCRLFNPSFPTINWPALKATLLDEFVPAHIIGWFLKALILRDELLLWVGSIGFEVLELTFAHQLENFNECWWDQWLLDVLICNPIGIYAGLYCLKYFQSNLYNWSGLPDDHGSMSGFLAQTQRAFLQFTPYSVERYEWRVYRSPLRLIQGLVAVASGLMAEINAFYLKKELYIPPTNPLNSYRLLIWFLLALPAIREWYDFVDSQDDFEGDQQIQQNLSQKYIITSFRKLGPFAWLCLVLTVVETLICLKFGKGLFQNPFPLPVVISWSLGLTLFSSYLIFWQLKLNSEITNIKE